MSATVDAQKFSDYFSNASSAAVPTLFVPGRTFPVQERYLEDILPSFNNYAISRLERDPKVAKYLKAEATFSGLPLLNSSSLPTTTNSQRLSETSPANDINIEPQSPATLVEQTIKHISNTTPSKGAILAFFPGFDAIEAVKRLLEDPYNNTRYKIFVLHSTVRESQNEVFAPVEAGYRKVILATNIAETSITVPDIQHVIDTGKVREKGYSSVDRTGMLKVGWISKASSKQRSGRAGRVSNGTYYALFTKARREAMIEAPIPEIQREDLRQLCLDIKSRGFRQSIGDLLQACISPPLPQSVATSVADLINLGALTEREQITPLGRILAGFPLSPHFAKLVILGIIYKCLDPMLILSSMSDFDLFRVSGDSRSQSNEVTTRFSGGSNCDSIALLNAFTYLRDAKERDAYNLAFSNDLSFKSFRQMQMLIRDTETNLVRRGLIPSGRTMDGSTDSGLNINSDNDALIKALLLHCFSPHLAMKTTGKSWFQTSDGGKSLLDPKGVNFQLRKEASTNETKLLTYEQRYKLAEAGEPMLKNTTEVTPVTAALFAQRLSVNRSGRHTMLSLGRGLQITCPDELTGEIVRLRKWISSMENEAFIYLAQNKELPKDARKVEVMSSIIRLLEGETPSDPRSRLDRVRSFMSRGAPSYADTRDKYEPIKRRAYGERFLAAQEVMG